MSLADPSPWERLATTPLHELAQRGPTGSLDWRRPIREANLPADVTELLVGVVRRTGLWRNERRTVAEELVAHFHDGLDAGATPESLVRDFGDPEHTARLIRRAKRRGRPAVWHAWWWSIRGAALGAVAYVALGAYLLTAKPTIDTDYLAQINAPVAATPEADRAWPVYERLLLELDERLGPVDEREQPGNTPAPLRRLWERVDLDTALGRDPTINAELDAWLTANADWLAELRAAANKPVFGLGLLLPREAPAAVSRALGWPVYEDQEAPTDPADLWDGWAHRALMPHQELRTFANLVGADFRHALATSDSARAADNLIAQWGMAHQAEEAPNVIGSLIGSAIRAMALEAIEKSLAGDASAVWTDADLLRVAHTLSQRPRPLAYHFDGALLATKDTIQRLYVSGGGVSLQGLRGFGQEVDKRYVLFDMSDDTVSLDAARLLYAPQVWSQLASETETTAVVERLKRLAIEEASTPLWLDPPSENDAYFDVLHNNPRYAVMKMLGVAYGHAIEHARRTDANTAGALIGIAMELYRRHVGEWPESLEQLAPRWIPAVPVDPINGGPLGYRLIDGKPVVYSLGRDRDDDGGREPAVMDDATSDRLGQVTLEHYRLGPPLTPELADNGSYKPDWYNGDWVLWSLAEPRYMPSVKHAPGLDED